MSNKLINKTSNALFKFYRPLLVVLLICGYDYKFYRNIFYLKFIVKIYCIFVVNVVIYSSLTCCPSDLSQIWSLLEYISTVFVMLFTKSQSEKFFRKITDIDSYLRINARHYNYVKYKYAIFTIINWLVRFAYTYLYCFNVSCYDVFILFAIRQWYLLALDLNRVWRCLLFDCIRYRLKTLRIRLEENPDCNYYLYVKNCKSIKENKIKFCLYIYRSIADLVDVISPELHASLFLSIAGCLPKLIANVFHIVTASEGLEPPESLGYTVMHLVQIALLLFTPFLVVEFYSIEVEKMQLFLTHKLMNDRDPDSKEDIEMFLRYTQIRTFKYKIFRIIPINVSLPLELINICITYVIVLINFSHLY